jgi:F-type H+-transporting ATPase subunit b
MDLVTPSIGLLFWMLVSFSIVLVLLKKFAWTPILSMIKEREDSIENALQSAQKAKEEMALLTASNEKLLQEARNERDRMLKEAAATKEAIVSEARAKATEDASRIMAKAREEINNDKMAAIVELKNQVATLSIDIAEKILKKQLDNQDAQKDLVSRELENVKLS